jgi:hypothetical protein
MPTDPPDVAALSDRLATHAERLAAALGDIDAQGGLAAVGRDHPGRAARAYDWLKLARAEIDEAMQAYKSHRRPPEPAARPANSEPVPENLG